MWIGDVPPIIGRMLPRLIGLTAAAALLLPAAASARTTTYKVVTATHESTASKAEDGYLGTSTAAWSLTKPTKLAVQRHPGGISGLGTVRVQGTYGVDVTTDWPGRCAWTAATGDETYPGVAPEPFQLTVSPDPRTPGKALVSFMAVQASLGNGYLGTECSTSISGEPDAEVTSAKTVSPGLFKRRRVTLRFAGTSADEGIAASWDTRIGLKRVK